MNEVIPHFFRTEYRKIVAVLCRRFGFDQIEIAEDIASETFLTAAETWGITGIPPNPAAWLYSVAKNKARNYLKRNATFENNVAPAIAYEALAVVDEIDLSPENINDSQLQMMFAVCHPSIAPEAQVGLSLRVLCGFGVEEIADAFLTSKETINKRLFRAKEKIKEHKITIEFPGPNEIDERLSTVLATIYLLFNEGYYSVSNNQPVRKELCLEAMRLCNMLVENQRTDKPEVNALLSLMCFHASRFDARSDDQGDQILYQDQDTSLWNPALISKGGYFFHRATAGNRLSKYHLEAAIAYWHTQQSDTPEKWESILQNYNRLLQLEYSPVAALNRTYALSKTNGKAVAIAAAGKLDLNDHHFYFVLLGELYSGVDDAKARENFERALQMAKTEPERRSIRKKLIR